MYAPEASPADAPCSWADNAAETPSGVSGHVAVDRSSGGAGLGRPQPNPEAGQLNYGLSAGGPNAVRSHTNVWGTIGDEAGSGNDAWPVGATREQATEPVDSYTAPLVAERARGVDGAGGHPHARHRIYQYGRPWEFDTPDWGSTGRLGLHILEVPGVMEPRGVGPGYVALPQPLTTRVPPPRWDEAYRLAPDGSVVADTNADTTGL